MGTVRENLSGGWQKEIVHVEKKGRLKGKIGSCRGNISNRTNKLSLVHCQVFNIAKYGSTQTSFPPSPLSAPQYSDDHWPYLTFATAVITPPIAVLNQTSNNSVLPCITPPPIPLSPRLPKALFLTSPTASSSAEVMSAPPSAKLSNCHPRLPQLCSTSKLWYDGCQLCYSDFSSSSSFDNQNYVSYQNEPNATETNTFSKYERELMSNISYQAVYNSLNVFATGELAYRRNQPSIYELVMHEGCFDWYMLWVFGTDSRFPLEVLQCATRRESSFKELHF